ncbi:hypothetical protein E4U30_003232 [Claviceps sp. LM220 group G6]|nr:hypothetical protein E4U15_000566 [Claviceps sp. LM218 group G6]KAG6094598.1 hypothetical protein E4U30_003232 [Claviceps sp. LM220 group G6]KAG6100245.1 hypothetical protein E4U31_004058 [Claviceps sp. LM219 group G6]
MGLPLFVEPDKSVPSNKVSFKDGATSPSYSESRHPSSRSEISDRRNGLRRANVRIYGPMQRAMRNSHDQRHQHRQLPWIEAPREQDRTDYSAADPPPRTFRGSQEALRDMTLTNESRGEPIEEWTDPIIRNHWRDSPPPLPQVTPDSMTEALELGWWPFGRLERQQRAGPDYASWRNASNTDSPWRSRPPLPRRTFAGVDISPPDVESQTTREVPNSRLANATRTRSRGLSNRPPRRTTRGVDGLGDRDRSLSPEVWDTLLSTLTADTPSVGSSSASAPASQTTGPSSGTPSTAPDVVGEVQIEPVCESGCEYSDNDLDTSEYVHQVPAGNHRRRQELRDVTLGDPHSRRVPDYNLDGMSESYSDFVRRRNGEPLSMMAVPATQITRNPGDGRSSTHIDTPRGSLTIYESTIRLRPLGDRTSADSPSAEVSGHRSPSHSVPQPNRNETSLLSQRDRSADAAERSGRGDQRQAQNATQSASSAGASTAADDWIGMQRIVRRLAQREDIPDGWWVEAGLTRIPHQGGNPSEDTALNSALNDALF